MDPQRKDNSRVRGVAFREFPEKKSGDSLLAHLRRRSTVIRTKPYMTNHAPTAAHNSADGWIPTFTEIATRANLLWEQDGYPARSELAYWIRAKQLLMEEHAALARQNLHDASHSATAAQAA